MAVDWTPLREIVRQGRHFLLTSHLRADCDALGSELGMADVLEYLGKQVSIVNGDAIPEHLRFIDPQQRIKELGRHVQAAELLNSADVFVVLDTSAWIQLGPMGDLLRQSSATKVVIDHHVSEDDLGAVNFEDPQAEATGRLVADAADALGVALSESMAHALFTAMATDTGWFRFSSVTSETYRTIARLVDAGAVPQTIYSQLYEQESLPRMMLRGRIMAGSQAELAGRLIWAEVRSSDFAAVGAQPADTEDAINRLLSVRGSEVALLLTELGAKKTKASLRSRGTVNVREVAEQFGGGGHNQAAGASLAHPLDAAREMVLDALRKAMR